MVGPQIKVSGDELAAIVHTNSGRVPDLTAYPFERLHHILALQALYDLSDDQAEFVIQDRLSFMLFLGLGLSDKVPDAKTIWLFRESLVRTGAIDNLFARFDKHLSRSGYLAKDGQIFDATIIQAPRQHNSHDEKDAIKAGEIPDEWKDKPAKLAQKDRDARWTVKYSKAKQPTQTPTSAATKQHDVVDGALRRHRVCQNRLLQTLRGATHHGRDYDDRPRYRKECFPGSRR